MDNFLRVVKIGWAVLIAAATLAFMGTSSAGAASYTYNLTGLGTLTGTITTSCNNCVLNATNVTAWNLSDPGVLSVSSAMSGSKFVIVPAGAATDMVATPTEIDFNFGDQPGTYYEFQTAQTNNTGLNPGINFGAGSDHCSFGCVASVYECASSPQCPIQNPSQHIGTASVYKIADAPPVLFAGSASSLFGTTVINTNQQIVDGQLDKWMLSGGQAYKNSQATPSAAVILLLYYDGVVYQENQSKNWWAWLNNAWVATSDPRVTSAPSSTIPRETHLVDASHTVWTLAGGQIYANGYLKTSSGVIKLLYAKGTIYQESQNHVWSVFSNGGWVATSAPDVASSSGTTVPAASQLIDSQLKTWTLSGGKAYVNGAATPSASVTELLYYNGSVYQKNVNNNWWQWVNNAWAALAADPRVPALAAAVGYKTLTFDSTVVGSTSGTWQPSNLNGVPGCTNAAVQNDDGSFTVRGYSNNIKQQCFVTLAVKSTTGVNGWTGVTFKPGMYLKLVVSSVGTNPSGFGTDGIPGNVVGFGAKAILHSDGGKKANGAALDQWPGQAPTFEHWQETDLFAETGPGSLGILYGDYYGNTAAGGSLNVAGSGAGGALAGGKTWAAQHTLEYVWVRATASVQGHIDGYIDGKKFTVDGDTTWTPYNPASPPQNYSDYWSIGDTQDTVFVTGTGTTNDLTVHFVQVWQTSPAGVTKQ